MKSLLKFGLIAIIFVALQGCQVQRGATKHRNEVKKEKSHQEALAALTKGKFRINLDESSCNNSNSTKSRRAGSYIAMVNNHAIINFPLKTEDRIAIEHSQIQDSSCEISKPTTDQNGDTLFSIKIDGGTKFVQERLVLITLYNNSNRCYVQINNWEQMVISTHRGEVISID